jgi:hypothetical protein
MTSYIQERHRCLEQGWMQTKDIAACVPCGMKTARDIRKIIESQVTLEGFENLKGCILTTRFLKYMHLSESKVKHDYEQWKKEKEQETENDKRN